MIRVTVDVLSARGSEYNRSYTAVIYNDATGDEAVGNYVVQLMRNGSKTSVWKAGEVKRFPRLKLGVWDLVFRALRETVGERNKS
jgi:hypothetical protein